MGAVTKRPASSPSPVGDVLDDVLKRVDPEQHMRIYRLWSFWAEEVGEPIARRAQPTGFRNGVLFVTVATQSWMQELQFMKATMRDRLNTRLGAPLIRDMFFVSGGGSGVPAPDAAETEVSPAGGALVPLPPIADGALAAAFGRIVEARAKRVARARRTRRTSR
jgi:predicted nucleic acid-binding Zn ribbon protein